MILDKAVLMGLGVLIGIYVLYKMFVNKAPVQTDFDQTYNKILNSDEHKVKGQYEK
ncbi:hypothetical protein ISS07_04150 [Candidatus Woesearchaeota archaeon]|nr:hypothetical protein [Candidatus Woesearchaeota archaeon]